MTEVIAAVAIAVLLLAIGIYGEYASQRDNRFYRQYEWDHKHCVRRPYKLPPVKDIE